MTRKTARHDTKGQPTPCAVSVRAAQPPNYRELAGRDITVHGVGVIPWANQGMRPIFRIGPLLAANAKWPKNEPDPKAWTVTAVTTRHACCRAPRGRVRHAWWMV